jgi:subtilisin family serine protease
MIGLATALTLASSVRPLLADYASLDVIASPTPLRADLRLKRLAALAPLGAAPQFGIAAPRLGRAAMTWPRIGVLVQLADAAASAALRRAGYEPTGELGRVASLRVSPGALAEILDVPGVQRIELALPHRMHLDVNTEKNGAVAGRATSGLQGSGVLIGVIDSGIDWRHADFRTAAGRTRIAALWDQLDDSFATSGGAIGIAPPARDESNQPLGTLYTRAQIDAALRGEGTVNSVDFVGHGTHTAGCAASNGRAPGAYTGVAPEAELLVVRAGGQSKTDLFIAGDTLAALQWIGDEAARLGMPVAVNMSFGQHFGAHDGSSIEELALDEFVATPGRVVAVSAGNERDADIHTSGSALGSRSMQARVTNATNDFLGIDCWFNRMDLVDLGFFDPTGEGLADADVPAGSCAVVSNPINRVSLCVDDADPTSGSREVFLVAEPVNAGGAITNGTWQIILRDEGGVHDGGYHCWSVNGQPFTADVDERVTVALPATARGALAVGAANFRASWPSLRGPNTQIDSPAIDDIAFFSSEGPTRDGRVKPDLVTGGNWVLSAWSEADGTGSAIAGDPPDSSRISSDGTHAVARGTSFAAPQAAGAAALLLEANPDMPADQLAARLRATARADAFTGAVPNALWGYGKLDVAGALALSTIACVADCDGDGVVTIDELVAAVSIALGQADLSACRDADGNGDGVVTVDELVAAVQAALFGCVT